MCKLYQKKYLIKKKNKEKKQMTGQVRTNELKESINIFLQTMFSLNGSAHDETNDFMEFVNKNNQKAREIISRL